MPLRLLIILSLAFLAGLPARAQVETAEGFFNSGAQFYISNNIPAALERTESGLKLYPNDLKLKKLEELLKQRQKQQSQQNPQKKNNQSKQNQQNHSQQPSQNKQQDQQKQQQQKKRQAQNQSEQQKQKQQQQARQNQEKQGGEKESLDQMTPQEAKRLLDSQKENEQFLQLKPNVPPPSKRPTEDW